MRRAAFTLVEVLVAVTILGLLLGATVTVVRTAQFSQAQSSAQLEVDLLATATINQFYSLKDGYAAAGNSNGFSEITGGLASADGIFVAAAGISSPCPSSGGSCPTPEQGGPLVMSWCPLPPAATVNPACINRLTSPAIVVREAGTSSLAQTLALNAINGVPAEYIALPVQQNMIAPKNRYIDASNTTSGTPIVVNNESGSTYRFYTRTISVAQIGAATRETQLKSTVYQIKVQVQSLSNTRISASQQALVSL